MDEFFKEMVEYARVVGRNVGFPVSISYEPGACDGELTVSCGDGRKFWGIMRFLMRSGDMWVRVSLEYTDGNGLERTHELEILKPKLLDSQFCSTLRDALFSLST